MSRTSTPKQLLDKAKASGAIRDWREFENAFYVWFLDGTGRILTDREVRVVATMKPQPAKGRK